MTKPLRTKFPEVASAWDAYDHWVEWEDLVDYKYSGIGHHYIALAWMEGDSVNYADMASVDGIHWEMQNDGGEPLTMKQWKAAKIPAGCDWMEYPDV